MKHSSYRVDTKPWYKYFWPWFVIGIIIWTLLSGAGMIYFSTRDGGRSLVDGYEKLGKASFDNQQWQRNAQASNIEATLIRANDKLALSVDPAHYDTLADLQLVFLHPTDENQDITAKLFMKNSSIRADMPQQIEGWQIKLRNEKQQWEVTNKFATRIQAVVKLR